MLYVYVNFSMPMYVFMQHAYTCGAYKTKAVIKSSQNKVFWEIKNACSNNNEQKG